VGTRTKILVGTVVTLAVAGGVAGVSVAAGGDDQPLSGPDRDRATASALERLGGGTVIETGTGDDGAAYGVEIRVADGSVVEVQLDGRFQVVGVDNDDDAGGEGGAGSDD
jgi:hypothetical protein